MTARMQLRKKALDEPPLLTLTSLANGGIVLGGLDNNVVATLTAQQSRTLGAGVFLYDVEFTHTNGVVRTPIAGRLILTQSITRSV